MEVDAKERAAAVQRVLRGEDAPAVAASVGVPAATLQAWRDRFVAAGSDALSDGPAALGAGALDLLDASPDFVIAKDRDYRFLFVNHAYARSVGASPEALVGRLDSEFWAPAASPESYRALDEEALTGRTVQSPRVCAERGGALHFFDVRKQPLHDAQGAVYGVLTFARDVTEAHRVEAALRASEARYRLLLEHAPIAIYVHDGKNVLFGNRSFAQLMAAPSPEALVGHEVALIAHPDELPKLQERVRSVRAGQLVSPAMDFRAVRLDGQSIAVRVMATKCVYEGQDAIQVVMIDETERLRAQSQRDALEGQLRHGQRLEALGTLSAGIAHDFNNTLAVILSNAELASQTIPREHPARQNLEELGVAADRAAALVRSILTFGRKQALERAPVQLAGLVQEGARLIRATLPAAIVLDVELSASDTEVVADATQVHQVLLNLCTNAWHAMGGDRPGHLQLAVDSLVLDEAAAGQHPDLHAGRYVRVAVRDNGQGMNADTLARIFEPFFTTKATGLGTGLGLSVVHGIMRAHGGAITVWSQPGVGTEFRAYFPASAAPIEPKVRPPAAAAPAPSGRHVLLVDDEHAVLSVIRRSLERLGLRVTAHSTVGAAVAAIRENAAAYDLILADQSLADGEGLSLAKAARQLRADLPVVLMSGFLDEPIRLQAVEFGVRGFLNKPFSIAQLTSAVQQVLAAEPPT